MSEPAAWCKQVAMEIALAGFNATGDPLTAEAVAKIEAVAAFVAAKIAAADPSAALREAAAEAVPALEQATPTGVGWKMDARLNRARVVLQSALAATAAPPCPNCERLREAIGDMYRRYRKAGAGMHRLALPNVVARDLGGILAADAPQGDNAQKGDADHAAVCV